MQEKISIEMGNYAVAKNPTILQTIGLGSCVAVCLYDQKNKIGGLAHIMSPKSRMEPDSKPMRFADQAIKMMIESMKKIGAKQENLSAKIIGGASMFPNALHFTSVGNDNIIAVRNELKEERIKVSVDDTGGNRGKSIWFDTTNGDVVVTTIRGGTKTI